MAEKIADDQLTEVVAGITLPRVRFRCRDLKAGILKGPVVRRKKVQKWIQGQGLWTMGTADELVLEYDRVSPFDIYPARLQWSMTATSSSATC